MEDGLKQWIVVCNKYISDAELSRKVFDMLVVNYSEDGRHYHNLQHVTAMLRSADDFYGPDKVPDTIFFATWFHDAIYNALKSDNEKQSALLAADWLSQLKVPRNMIQKIEALILKTANHLEAEALDMDTQFFLDADLKILGADSSTYKLYKEAVRKEYSWYPDLLFNAGRKKFIKKTLAAPRIFRTEKFYRQYEEQARVNLKSEV